MSIYFYSLLAGLAALLIALIGLVLFAITLAILAGFVSSGQAIGWDWVSLWQSNRVALLGSALGVFSLGAFCAFRVLSSLASLPDSP